MNPLHRLRCLSGQRQLLVVMLEKVDVGAEELTQDAIGDGSLAIKRTVAVLGIVALSRLVLLPDEGTPPGPALLLSTTSLPSAALQEKICKFTLLL